MTWMKKTRMAYMRLNQRKDEDSLAECLRRGIANHLGSPAWVRIPWLSLFFLHICYSFQNMSEFLHNISQRALISSLCFTSSPSQFFGRCKTERITNDHIVVVISPKRLFQTFLYFSVHKQNFI